jgi:hypothetical protein
MSGGVGGFAFGQSSAAGVPNQLISKMKSLDSISNEDELLQNFSSLGSS